jgi:hypothetical protein
MNYVDTHHYGLQEQEELAAELIGWYLNEHGADEARQILSAIVIPGRDQCTIEGSRLKKLIDAAADEWIPLRKEPSVGDVRSHLEWHMRIHDREFLSDKKIVQNMTTNFADLLYDLYRKN